MRITAIERKNEAIIQLEKKLKLRDKKIKKLREEKKVLKYMMKINVKNFKGN